MAYRVEIAPRALADLEAAYYFIKKDSRERASIWLLGIIDAVLSLEELPDRCPLAPESADAGREIRILLYGKRLHAYKIFFSIISGKFVYVFHVRHWARERPLADDLKLAMS